MEEKEIYEGVKDAIVEALGVEPEEVEAKSSLFDDLGAESLDLLDILFRIEKTFGIKIPRGGLQEEISNAEDINPEDVVVDGALTALGAEKLKEKMKEIDEDKIVEGFRIDDLPTLFTVQTFVNMVKSQLAAK